MKILIGVLLPLFVWSGGHSLKTLVNNAVKHNDQIKSKVISIKAKDSEIAARESAFWPTVDVGASYSLLSPNSLTSPGQVATGYVSVRMELYDGGRKDALLRAKVYEREASVFEKRAFEKSVTLEIVRRYYGIYQLRATLGALGERASELKAQISRVKKFNTAGLSTQEDIDKLQAVYDNNDYTIANTRLALATSIGNLELLSGLSGDNLRYNHFREPRKIRFEVFESTRMLQARANGVGENAVAIDAGYMPQVAISDTYSQSHFGDTVSMGALSSDGLLLDHQNKVMLSATMRLFDNGKMRHDSQSVKYQKMALLSRITHAKKEQFMNFKLARKSLTTTRTKLNSANSALRAARSTYVVIKQKFEVGVVDNIAYLDALTQKILAQARYKETLYDYEIAKSIYYYYAGKDPKEFML